MGNFNINLATVQKDWSWGSEDDQWQWSKSEVMKSRSSMLVAGKEETDMRNNTENL